MTIADHPFHRSEQAMLTHPALASGDDAHPAKRVKDFHLYYTMPVLFRCTGETYDSKSNAIRCGSRDIVL